MGPFLIVVIVMLISFTVTFAFQDGTKDVDMDKVWENFKMMYKVMFGNFDTLEKGVEENGGKIGWALYFFVTVMIPLVMLNLLIAVISETHSRVMEHQEKSDNLELNQIILELETFLKVTSPDGNKSYLVIAEYSDDFGANKWKGRVQATTNKVKNDLDSFYNKLKNENLELKEEVKHIKQQNEKAEDNIKIHLSKQMEESTNKLIDEMNKILNTD